MSNGINLDLLWDFRNKFGGGVGYDEAYGGAHCYEIIKTEKAYFVDNLTDDQIEALMKKSLETGHDYLLDAVKDNECPPLDPDCDY